MMRSLRARLMWGTGTAAALILLAAMGAGYELVRSTLIDEFDDSLLTQAHSIAAMTETRHGMIVVDAEPGELPEFQKRENPEFFQLFDSNGKSLVRSQSLGLNQSLESGKGQGSFRPAILPNGRSGRLAAFHFQMKSEEDEPVRSAARVTVVVGRDTVNLAHTLHHVGWLFFSAAAFATVAIVSITVALIGRELRPLRRLSWQIGSIDTHNLTSRLDAAELPDELSPIVTRLNQLLERLQNAFDRERSFTADAAHELRTPLAGLDAALEVCASRDREPEAYQSVIRECLGVVRSMNGMVEGLLLLARADAGHVQLAVESASVEDLLAESWRSFHTTAEERSLRVQWQTAPELSIETDRAKLKHVLSNLLDNAVRYTDAGGSIRVVSDAVGAKVRIRIANTGSRVSAEDAAKVFERFWRGDQSRTATGTHSGLGLAVCAKLIQVLKGTIAVTSEMGGEFMVEVCLPGSVGL